MTANPEHVRIVEALLFAAKEPLNELAIANRLPDGTDIVAIFHHLQGFYEHKGINLVRVADKWAFMTAPDLSWLMEEEVDTTRKLSRAALETLAIIAYHQPITRTEVEGIRGVSLSRGIMDVLFEARWIQPKGRRRSPGRPVTYGITEEFLVHFGLNDVSDLPGIDEMKASGLLSMEPLSLFEGIERNENSSVDDDEED